MRILLVHSGNAVGGDSAKYTFVMEQGRALEQQGCEVAYYAVVGHGLRGYLKNVRPLRKKIADCLPDVVHAHYGLCGMVAALAVGNTPLVTTFHNGETLNIGVNTLSSLFAMRAKHVVYVAQHIYDMCYLKGRHYTILPCGVEMQDMQITPQADARKQLGWREDTRYILFGGSISNKRKNYPLLANAVKLILERNPEQRIEIVEMRGFSRAECVQRMCACDVFCLPSLSEGSPQALKEAMACNCPAVATDMADVRKLFGNEPGYWVSAFNVVSMADCLTEALSYTGRTAGRERILSLGLSNELVAQQLIGIYTDITR